jgi:ATP phosphoribosyltransferase regulatory subunit
MGIVTGLLSEIDIPDSGKQEIVKCIGEKNLHTLQAICERYEVSDEDTQRLSGLVSIYGPIKTALPKIDKLCTNETMKSAVAELRNICKVLDNDNTNLDFSVVNDMKYYNGIVFQGFVDGIPEGILSGGQYDKLMKQMGKCSSAIGFAVYIDLLERFKSIKGEQN